MYEGIYLVFIRSLCIFVDILTVYFTFIHFLNIKYEYNITLSKCQVSNLAPLLFQDHVSLFADPLVLILAA